MRAMIITVGLLAVLPLAGCIFPPQLLEEGPGGVSVRMNGYGARLGNAQSVADKACGEYSAVAELAGTEAGFGDGTMIEHYRCTGAPANLGLASADDAVIEEENISSEEFADHMQRKIEDSVTAAE